MLDELLPTGTHETTTLTRADRESRRNKQRPIDLDSSGDCKVSGDQRTVMKKEDLNDS